MFIVLDTETDGLDNPSKIWVAVAKEVESGKVHIFRHLHQDRTAAASLKKLLDASTGLIGHNLIGYDLGVLKSICGITIDQAKIIDTLVVARLLNYSAEGGNSLDAIGHRLGFPKGSHSDWSQWSQEMEDYCIRDVEVTFKFYEAIKDFLFSDSWKASLRLEHDMAFICEEMRGNGFAFDYDKAQELYKQILQRLEILDEELVSAFPPKPVAVREITPKATASGTLHRGDFRWLESNDLTPYSVGSPFTRISFERFNPGSTKQIVERLNEAGWAPTEKTKGHLQAERDRDTDRLEHFRTYGWSISEKNLQTLPSIKELELWENNCLIKIPPKLLNIIVDITKTTSNANEPTQGNTTTRTSYTIKKSSLNVSTDLVSKTLNEWLLNSTTVAKFVESNSHLWSITVIDQDAYVDCSATIATQTWDGLRNTELLQKRISTNKAAQKLVERLLLDSRRSTLVEWFNAYNPTTRRIHGKFNHIGAWTGRMSHAGPNMANIPAGDSLYAHEMRSFWTVSEGNYLVGVDADGIQLRILAHYMNDRRFTEGLVNGRKEDGTDAHTLNKLALGSVCKDRDTAKTFIYAFLLGAGVAKVAEILGCTQPEARRAVQQFIEAYPGLKALKEETIPRDASRGYFIGLDGRAVLCDSEHHMLAGYLQNGEAIVMKTANRLWRNQLKAEGITGWKQVNFIHDEWQTEVEDFELAKYIAKVQANSIKEAGILLGVKCPLEGSFLNSHKELSIGKNWAQTH